MKQHSHEERQITQQDDKTNSNEDTEPNISRNLSNLKGLTSVLQDHYIQVTPFLTQIIKCEKTRRTVI